MRTMIGEMDILVAQLYSELKFIKNGMIFAFFKKKKKVCLEKKYNYILVSMLLLNLLSS